MVYSINLSPELKSEADKSMKRLGVNNFSAFVAEGLKLLTAQDKQSFQFLHQYSKGAFSIASGVFIHLLLLDKLAKDLVEMEHSIPDNIFYIAGNGRLLQGEEFFKLRYARYKKAYQQAATFKKQIDDCAAEVAAEKVLNEIEKKIEQVPE